MIILEALNGGDMNSSYKIKYLVSDCDGVLTDGKYYYSNRGKELITFNAKDHMAATLIKRSVDMKLIIISSASDTSIIEKRMGEIGIDFYRATVFCKLDIITSIVELDKTAYIGDSLDDLAVFEKVAISFAPSDAHEYVKNCASFVLSSKGGDGCVLEAFTFLRNNYEDYIPK